MKKSVPLLLVLLLYLPVSYSYKSCYVKNFINSVTIKLVGTDSTESIQLPKSKFKGCFDNRPKGYATRTHVSLDNDPASLTVCITERYIPEKNITTLIKLEQGKLSCSELWAGS